MPITSTETTGDDGFREGDSLAGGLRADVVVACSSAERFAAIVASDRARRIVVLDFGLGHSAPLSERMPVLCARTAAADRLPEGSFCLRLTGDQARIALAVPVVERLVVDAWEGRGAPRCACTPTAPRS